MVSVKITFIQGRGTDPETQQITQFLKRVTSAQQLTTWLQAKTDEYIKVYGLPQQETLDQAGKKVAEKMPQASAKQAENKVKGRGKGSAGQKASKPGKQGYRGSEKVPPAEIPADDEDELQNRPEDDDDEDQPIEDVEDDDDI